MPKSWSDKFSHPPKPVVKSLDKPFAGHEPGANMLIPTPAMLAAYVEGIPAGESRSMPCLRDELAAANRADFTCPLTTGIFLRIAAERAWELHQAGKPLKSITPFWRVVDLKSPMAKKLACGLDFLTQQRKREKLE